MCLTYCDLTSFFRKSLKIAIEIEKIPTFVIWQVFSPKLSFKNCARKWWNVVIWCFFLQKNLTLMTLLIFDRPNAKPGMKNVITNLLFHNYWSLKWFHHIVNGAVHKLQFYFKAWRKFWLLTIVVNNVTYISIWYDNWN